MANTSYPRIKVTLTKTMDRDKKGLSKRFEGAKRVFDITPFLGDQGMVRTFKTLYQPAGGFNLVFPDQPDAALLDSLYGLVEPMDVVEIRMGRAAGELPIIMRGFVVKVGRSESMGPDGSPQRVVLVQGQDYGAVLHWCNINWNLEYMKVATDSEDARLFLETFKLPRVLGEEGPPPVATPAGELVQVVVERLCNTWLGKLDAINDQNAVVKLQFDTDSVTDGSIGTATTGQYEGDVWGFIAAYGDLDWNEAFVEDRPDGPYLVYRPKPWRHAFEPDLYLMPGAKDPGTVKMDALYLRASNLGHGMEQVANYYRVDIRVSLMTPTLLYNDALLNSASLHETENTAIKLFGLRIRQAMTTQEGNAGPLLTEGDAAFRAEFEGLEANWLSLRIKQLKALHEDNVIWEDGTLQLAGDPGLAVGKYLELTRGNFVANYYINGVDHVYQPLRDWNTTVHVERGTGFLKRVQTGPAPIWQEGRPGAYGA